MWWCEDIRGWMSTLFLDAAWLVIACLLKKCCTTFRFHLSITKHFYSALDLDLHGGAFILFGWLVCDWSSPVGRNIKKAQALTALCIPLPHPPQASRRTKKAQALTVLLVQLEPLRPRLFVTRRHCFKHTPHRVGNIGDVPVSCVKYSYFAGCTCSRVSSTLHTALATLGMYL